MAIAAWIDPTSTPQLNMIQAIKKPFWHNILACVVVFFEEYLTNL
jgi:hypothetical protein